MNQIFQGKTAFVTGAASGIGKAAALAFASRGARVAVVDIQPGEAVADEIKKAGGQAVFIRCDVSKSADVQAAVDQTVSTFGSLDVAFNNAGIEPDSMPAQDIAEAEWDRVLDINLKGGWLCMKYQLPHMLRQGKGAIVNCASIAGLVGFPAAGAYVASKHGVVGLTRTAALENAKLGVRVNAVCPGVIHTPMIDRFAQGDPETMNQLAQTEPIGRMGTPDEIAESVVWLCSDSASFVTGQALAVDGGWVAQ